MCPQKVHYVSREGSLCVHREFIMCPHRVHYVSTESSLCVHTEFIMCPQRVHYVSTQSSLCVHREFIMCPQRVHHVSTESLSCVHREFIMCPQWVYYVSKISHGTSSPSCFPACRDQVVKAREQDGLACRTYNQPNYFYRTDPSRPWPVNQSVVENHYTEGTCLIRPV